MPPPVPSSPTDRTTSGASPWSGVIGSDPRVVVDCPTRHGHGVHVDRGGRLAGGGPR